MYIGPGITFVLGKINVYSEKKNLEESPCKIFSLLCMSASDSSRAVCDTVSDVANLCPSLFHL